MIVRLKMLLEDKVAMKLALFHIRKHVEISKIGLLAVAHI